MNHTPLSDREIVTQVDFYAEAPPSITQPDLPTVRKFLHEARATLGMSGTVAVWRDGVWALLAHDPAWDRPRPQQLLRAYLSSFAAGIRLKNHNKSVSSD